MSFPQYPQPKTDNIKPDGYNGKLDVPTLLALAESFQKLGLFAVPKKAGDKIAHWKFWMKRDGHVPLEPTEANLREWLPHTDIDGLILAVGRSLNGRLAVLDLDPAGDHSKARATYEEIQALSPTGFVVTTPSNGLHLYYRLPEGVEPLKPTTRVHWQNVDIRAKNSLIGLPGSFQQYTDKAEKKGVAYGHVGYYRRLVGVEGASYESIPTMSLELYKLLWEAQNPQKTNTVSVGASSYEQSAAALARIEAHLARPLAEQERLTLELLGFVLAKWENKTYDQWLQMWMAAHHASSGSSVVRDFIATHDNVWRGRPHSEVASFVSGWDHHVPKPDGFTVASLMYLARLAGWLATTGLEIPDNLTTKINTRYISDWTKNLAELPTRILLQSQTGSGKTYNIRYLYERLDKPKTVIFVPSIKLAMELAGTLKNEQNLPVTLYIDPATGRTKNKDILREAKILVTTLQTFSTKVFGSGVPMSAYGLVYIEESDQLFQQFARGGGQINIYSSHVSDREARAGFACLRAAFEQSGNVWCVDATMTQITYQVAEAMRGENSLTLVRNTHVEEKATVQMVASKGEAYQQILRGLSGNKRVVVAADTAQVAEEVVSTMKTIGALDGKKALVITSHTERNREVHRFMDHVNGHAGEYDLIAYNSVMASGVSVTAIKPDIVVQICNYLTPRVNLQLLNRYRRQEEVYCYYVDSENLYMEDDKSLLSEAYRRAGLEAMLINIPLAERTDDATLRAKIAAMSAGDEFYQRRSPKEFYSALLERDGRNVIASEPLAVSGAINASLRKVREVKKAEREYLKSSWHETRPINKDNPADPDMNEIQVAQGEIHAKILSLLGGNIPDEDPTKIYDVVHSFAPAHVALTSFVTQGEALKVAENYLADEGRAITTVANNVTLIKVLANEHYLFSNIEETLTTETLSQRADAFMAAMVSARGEYDAVIQRKGQKFEEVYQRSDTNIERAIDFSKIILGKIGLKQRVVRGVRRGGETTWEVKIVNAEEAKTYLKWRYKDAKEISLTNDGIKTIIQKRQPHIQMYQAMTTKQQKQVMKLLNDERTTDFPTAVEAVLDGFDKI